MAYITFFARKQFVASTRLDGPLSLGRSLDCDVYIPDVFVSRHHCQFVPKDGGWVIVDLDSANGIYFQGRRVPRHPLRQDDVVEVGSIAIVYDEGELPASISSTAPFGAGARLTELVETVFAGGLRPADYARKEFREDVWQTKSLNLIEDDESPEEQEAREAEEWSRKIERDWTGLLALDLPEASTAIMELQPAPSLPGAERGQTLTLESQPRELAPAGSAAFAATPLAPMVGPGAAGRSFQSGPGGGASLWEQAGASRSGGDVNGNDAARPPARKPVPVKYVSKKPVGERLMDLKNADVGIVLEALRDHWVKSVSIAAAAVVLIWGGLWIRSRVTAPPTVLPNGQANPAYYDGSDHS